MIRAARLRVACALSVLCLLAPLRSFAQGELRFCLHADPKTFNPLMVDDDASEAVRYLTGGTLVRLNRRSQQLEPELATRWKTSSDGRRIEFTLREAVRFSDGSPFGAEDVAFTMRSLMDPALHSPLGDSFRSGPGEPQIEVTGSNHIAITFPAPVAGLDKLFDEVAILSAQSPLKERAVLGPFVLADYKPGLFVYLKRNPNYWKKDSAGRPLPYLDSVRLDVQQNREIELTRFRRGEIQLINAIDGEYFDRLQAQSPAEAFDAGPSFDSEEMWFNQSPSAPLPSWKLGWFRSTEFRQAISSAINRQDMSRLVFNNHASPAAGPVSPANRFWFNSRLKPHSYDPAAALRLLRQAGFRVDAGVLHDSGGHAVEFSIVTNSGNKARERMAAMIQQDLGAIGIKVSIVTLDFPSLIERMTRSFNYEACLLGLVNTGLDPNAQMNVWLSSGENHQWNPAQKTPATPWEGEIDRLMRAQASATDPSRRKQFFDRVQEIAWEQQPFIYLVHKNALSAVARNVQGADPVVLSPQTYWQIERMKISNERAAN
ncbi:MAG: ABC transporter substrate-binding protein [Acidobacteria bacterium]|nr:ABC transporter substrate-binding protein [Acidobacteriota bacterium]